MIYTIEYTTGSVDANGNESYQVLSASYEGAVTQEAFNIIAKDENLKNVKFKVYKSGSVDADISTYIQYFYSGGTQIQFTSYYTLQEHKYMCVVNAGEFQNTQNPTFYDESGSIHQFQYITHDSSGSESIFEVDDNFRTFSTAVGLYDNSNNLLAYGKFANPIKIEKEIDSVFIIKFDI